MSKKDDVAYSLQTLCHPASEFLADGQRLTLFIKRGNEAAAEILRLRAESEKLRAALKPFADMAEKQAKLCLGPDIDHWLIGECDLTLGDLRAAVAAYLGEKDD